MVAELERNLETEKPRMNVDLRKTLSGPDQGKNIDYAVSELRTLDLLEQLCPGMRNYGVAKQDDGTATFQRYNVNGGSVRIGGSLTLGDDKHRVDQTRLESFCYALVEEHEDLLSEAIRKAGLLKKAKDEELNRINKAKRKQKLLLKEKNNGNNNGKEENEQEEVEFVDTFNPYDELDINIDDPLFKNLDENEKLIYVKKIYRKLSKLHHPDKNKGNVDSVKKFVKIGKAYESITGDEISNYGNLYREICLDISGFCSTEEEIEKQKFYFPRYSNSEKFGENTAGGGLEDPKIKKQMKKNAKRRKKAEKKAKKSIKAFEKGEL